MSEYKTVVSVIMPTFNREHLISRAVGSVLNQTFRDFELIIVDDGSRDNSGEVIREFNDSRINYIRHEKNRGVAAARNTGIKAARGEYVAFLDSDDEWRPQMLYRQIKAFGEASSDAGAVYTDMINIDNNKTRSLYGRRAKEGNLHKAILKGFPVYLQTIMVKKACLDQIGLFDEEFTIEEDYDFMIRLSGKFEFKYIREPLAVRHLMPDSVSVKSMDNILNLEKLLRKHFDEINRDRSILASHYFILGTFLCLLNRLSRGREYYFKAIKAYPADIRPILGLMGSVFGYTIYKRAFDTYASVEYLVTH